MDPEQVIARVAELQAAATDSVDRDKRGAEHAASMKPFAKGEMWQFAPESERRKASEAIIAEQDAYAGECLFNFERFVLEAEPVIDATISDLMEPPSAEAAIYARYNVKGMSIEAREIALLRSELREQNLRGELQSASPVEILSMYQRALSTGDDCAVRVVESGLSKRRYSSTEPRDIAAVQALAKAIEQARRNRVPENVRNTQHALKQARVLIGRIKNVHKIEPKRPAA